MRMLSERQPSKPGVYLFKNEHGTVLYVGKAKNLRLRVASYFKASHGDRPWIAVMIGLIRDIETIVLNNELEALILEANLIKDYQPRFNIMLTDDRAFPYIRLSVDEHYPRFQIVRRRADDKAKYFGPYLSAWSARLTCEFLRRLYGVHLANQTILPTHDHACLNCQLEGNLCPRTGQITTEAYAIQVTKVIDFLRGKRMSLIKDIENRMSEAAKQHRFELAAKLRDQLRATRQVTAKQKIVSQTTDRMDALALAKTDNSAVIGLTMVRGGIVWRQKHFSLKVLPTQTAAEILRQFMTAFYPYFTDIPPLIVVGEEFTDHEIMEGLLTQFAGQRVELRLARSGDKAEFLKLAVKNAQTKLETILLERTGDFSALIALKELLNLSKLPLRIEAVDISNLGVSEPVGATACFINGVPEKSEYRRYKIKTVGGQNDFAMIAELTSRRFSNTSRPLPDLFVIDGGPEQLKAALTALRQLAPNALPASRNLPSGDQIPRLIALAKKPDRIFLPDKKRSVPTSRGDKGVRLLARVRDEVHRYAIGFQRQRQRKKSLGNKNLPR